MKYVNFFSISAVETHGRASHPVKTHGRASHLAQTHQRASQSSALSFVLSLALWLIISASALTAQSWPPAGMAGSGTETEPWEIETPAHLKALADYVNDGNGMETQGKFYKLINDIDLSDYAEGSGWEPIAVGPAGVNGYSFYGNFNGNNKKVTNLTINRPTEDYIGLFGYISDATIENLGIEDCNITGQIFVGGLFGIPYNTIIKNCYVIGSISGDDTVGGLGGRNRQNSTIENSYANVIVVANYIAGGLVGANEVNSNIENCYATGAVEAYETDAGGLAGSNYATIENSFAMGNVKSSGNNAGGLVGGNYGNIKNSFAMGNVEASANYAGGLAGVNWGSSGSIENCYATGNVSGYANDAGGLVGSNATTIKYCYATGDIGGTALSSGGLVGGNGANGVIENCVAANSLISVNVSMSNTVGRVVGWGDNGFCNNCANNYANIDMEVIVNGNPVTITEGTYQSGTGVEIETLQSIDFYTTDNNWANETPWDFDVWNICDGITFPWLRWEDLDCGNLFVPVSNIVNVPTTAMAGVPLTLTATVQPGNATNKTIVWSVENAGSTGATIEGNIFLATDEGDAQIKATIENGLTEDTPYVQFFTIEVGPHFVPVEEITDLPTQATAGVPLTLTGTVMPEDASFQNIVWTVTYAGTTGAYITEGNIFNATGQGMAMVKAAIINGEAIGTPFEIEFPITVIVVPQVLSVTISPKTVTLQPSETQQFTVAVDAIFGADESVEWSITGNESTATDIDTDGLLTVSAAEPDGTIIIVTVTSVFSPAIFDEATVTVQHVGIDVNTHGRTYPHVYPNPTSGKFSVISYQLSEGSAEIYDISGRKLSTFKLDKLSTEIDISHLANGIYFIKINNETIKIVKN